MLTIYNTLSRRKEVFIPLIPGKVAMYVCGMTVYDYCHLGHARVLLVFDMVQRWLRMSGYHVTYVRNITDVDDKIIERARKNGETIQSLTDRFICAMNEDCQALGIQKPDHEPRATLFIPQMLSMIDRLVLRGLAYQVSGGDVNFFVRGFSEYGKLSGKSIDALRSGERVAIDTSKRDPLDFVLWKISRSSQAGECCWPSSYGEGRPGWHIECSAMATSLLGDSIDIHGGGEDLMFPHHENEIAQSEGVHLSEAVPRQQFVKYWMHNGFIRVEQEKMSKSLGNFKTIRDVLKKVDPEVLRLLILRKHYRSPLNYSDLQLEDARKTLLRLYRAIPEENEIPLGTTGEHHDKSASYMIDWSHPYAERFRQAMDDDFNTSLALSVLFECANALIQNPQDIRLAQLYKALGGCLGLLQRSAQWVRKSGLYGGLDSKIDIFPSKELLGVEDNYEGIASTRMGEDSVNIQGQGISEKTGLSERNQDSTREDSGSVLLSDLEDRDKSSAEVGVGRVVRLDRAQYLSEDDIAEKISARIQAKSLKNYLEADRIRSELAENGILLEDTATGTVWRKA